MTAVAVFSRRACFVCALSLFLALACAFPPLCAAMDREVTSGGDSSSDPGTLRYVLGMALDDDNIVFASGVDTVTLSETWPIGVSGNRVTINGTRSGADNVAITYAGTLTDHALILQSSGTGGLALKNVTFKNISARFSSDLLGGGLVSASETASSPATLGALSGVLFTGNTVTVDGLLLYGGALVGAYSEKQEASTGDVDGSFTSNAVAGRNLRGGGLVGAYSEDTAATVGAVRGLFADNTITGKNVIGGGGLVGAYSAGGKAALGDVSGNFTNNEIEAKTVGGGGLVGVEGRGRAIMGAVKGSFENNTVTLANDMYGGGLVGGLADRNKAQMGAVSADFKNNTVTNGASVQGGGLVGLVSDYESSTMGAVNANFTDNTVKIGDSLKGGGLVGSNSGDSTATIGAVSGSFESNTVNANNIFGGGLVGTYASSSKSSFMSQIGAVSASFKNNTVAASVLQGGGLVGAYDNGAAATVKSVSGNFENNTVNVSSLYGGGLVGVFSANGAPTLGAVHGKYNGNTITVSNKLFGGGIIGAWTDTASHSATLGGLSGVSIKNNTVTVGTKKQKNLELYGALVGFSGLAKPVEIRDTQITGNRVNISAESWHESGGLIYVGTDRATGNARGHVLTLAASAGKRTDITNNHMFLNENIVTVGILFGRTRNNSSLANAELSVRGESGGVVVLEQPLHAMLNNGKAFTMNVNGAVQFTWGGKNIMNAAGGSQLTFNSGSDTRLMSTYTLAAAKGNATGGDLRVNIKKGASLSFYPLLRNPSKALFDFTKAANVRQKGAFNAEGGTLSIKIAENDGDAIRILPSIAEPYLIAKGIHTDDLNAASLLAGEGITGFIKNLKGEYWAKVHYESPFAKTLGAWGNLTNATVSLQALLVNPTVSDATFNSVTGSLTSTTPDQAVNQPAVSVQVSGQMAGAAVERAFTGFSPAGNLGAPSRGGASPGAPEPGNVGFSTSSGGAEASRAFTIRPWAGYTGSFSRQDSHGGYHGYKQDVNGAVFGLNLDFEKFSAGVYAGYSKGHTRTRGASSRVTTDGVHVGLLAKVAPCSALPGFAITADAGYAHFSNESRRNAGAGSIEADFNQNAFSAGLGLEHAFTLGSTQLTPFLKGRYTYMHQDAVNENGGLTRASIGSVSGYSLSTDLGLKAGWEFNSDKYAFLPYLSASWQHEFGDRDFSTSARYASPSGGYLPAYTVRSVKADRDGANLGVGFTALRKLESGSEIGLNLGYNALVSPHASTHSLSAIFELRF